MKLKSKRKLARRKKAKKKRKISTGIALLSFAAIFTFLAVWATLQQSHPKDPASEYFEFVPITVVGNYKGNKIWEVESISFDLRPIKGDANNVIINSWAYSYPIELGDLKKGQWYSNYSTPIILLARLPYVVEETDDGKIPIRIYIKSREAEGYVTLVFESPLG